MNIASKNIRWFDKNRKELFWSFSCLLLLAASYYIYLVNTAARNGARYGEAERNIASIGASISELESNYLSLKQSVTLSLAYANGFQDVKTVKFIVTPKVGTVARANEI